MAVRSTGKLGEAANAEQAPEIRGNFSDEVLGGVKRGNLSVMRRDKKKIKQLQ